MERAQAPCAAGRSEVSKAGRNQTGSGQAPLSGPSLRDAVIPHFPFHETPLSGGGTKVRTKVQNTGTAHKTSSRPMGMLLVAETRDHLKYAGLGNDKALGNVVLRHGSDGFRPS